jgi:hypothetical protein
LNNWKPEEVAAIKELAGSDHIDRVVRTFQALSAQNKWTKREGSAIKVKMKKLRLSFRAIDGGYTCATLSEALGIERTRAQRWVNNGLLKSLRSDGQRFHCITVSNFRDFALKNPRRIKDISTLALSAFLSEEEIQGLRENKPPRGRAVPVRHVNTGKIYRSLTEAGKAFYIDRSAIRKSIYAGRECGNGLKFEFLEKARSGH